MDKMQRQSFHQLYAKPILFVGVLLLLAGFYSYTRMQTNLFPEVLFPRITVIADAGQQPVDRMMITVTKPLESAVKKVQGTTVVKSSTSRGSCVIDVYFQWGLDIYALKTQLESRINEIKNFLPAGTVISTEAMNQSLFPVYGFTLESDTHSRIALRDAGNLVVRPMFSQAVPLMTVSFGQRIADLLGDLMSTAQPIEVKIFGDDYAALQQIAARAEKIMQSVSGVVDIDNGLVPAGASIVFIPDENKLSLFGISLTDFQEQLQAYTGGIPLSAQANIIEPHPAQAAMTGGLQIGSVQDGEQMRRILLRFTDFPDNSPELLRRQPVFLPDGSIRPLETLCDIRIIPGEIEQRREDLKSNITLTARLEGRDLGSAVQDLQREFKQQLHLPSGYSISFGGAYSEQQQSFRELTAILLLATLLVLTVLMFLLREWRISFAVLFISLMGICGCLLALWITGVPLNVSSYTGIIMIVGILAENSIFTVWQYKTNRRNGGTVDESVDYAIALRIRPKLMTAIGAVLALMPLALGLGMGAQMQQPLAVAVIGGFTVGLPLLLVVLPALMRWIYRKYGNSSNFI